MTLRTLAVGLSLIAAEAAQPPASNILSLDSQMLVDMAVQWVNVLVLVIVLAFVLYKPVKKMLTQRSEGIKNDIDTARQAADEAEALRQKYETMIAGIEKERDEILRQGREAALERSEEIIDEARREAANIFRRSMEDLRVEQENVMDETRKAIVEISTRLAARFVTVSIDAETQDRYVDDALNQLEGALWED